MKRGKPFLAAAIVIAAAFGMLPARSDEPLHSLEASPHAGCTPASDGSLNGHAYLYCGYHWPSLPVKLRIATDGAPANVRQQFTHLVQNASAEWNQWWPGRGARCGAILCTDAGAANTISFGVLPEHVLGQTIVTSEGKTITHVDVVLNIAANWQNANGSDVVTGEQAGLAASACATCHDWFDLQDVVTHELGHVLGLEDLGDQSHCLGDLTESVDFSQTMYGCFWPGDTSKRTLSWGDVDGLRRLSLDY
ncbi:MAG: hypothetical protein ABR548_00685 [Actinomycetota bacterium]|nr:hypothetical protein [Actinomycetota bacterium]